MTAFPSPPAPVRSVSELTTDKQDIAASYSNLDSLLSTFGAAADKALGKQPQPTQTMAAAQQQGEQRGGQAGRRPLPDDEPEQGGAWGCAAHGPCFAFKRPLRAGLWATWQRSLVVSKEERIALVLRSQQHNQPAQPRLGSEKAAAGSRNQRLGRFRAFLEGITDHNLARPSLLRLFSLSHL